MDERKFCILAEGRMPKHHHRFVDAYEGPIGLGLDREIDELTLTYYLQKFSDDDLMDVIRSRLSDQEIEALFNTLSLLMKKHLTDEEYHRLFLKDEAE
jgi:hypothetical protein